MRFILILAAALAIYWTGLSGYFKPMLISLGIISILLVLGLVHRMKIMDGETAPYGNMHRTLYYSVWLFREIVKANVEVVKAVMSPELEVSPTLVKVPTRPTTDIGKTMFANSITLTPGTVSMEIGEKEILVHALLEPMSASEGFDEMSARSAWSVGEPLDRARLM
ncbi:MAG: Na+/H+ antiporter subunit E [Hyphomonadaceae bacterium]|nr:Na+/H+ antiporter subunit E [Hyphomonadaceae bacterium]MBC6411527.1 Na+/H+ antiporter subunit E [Hyphomonadaceae bacterium]